MKTLDEIKEEVAKERGFKDWDALFTACGSFSLERRMDIVAERYAEQFKPKWIPVKEATDAHYTDYSIVLFDTGEVCKWSDENWPKAIATDVFALPEPPERKEDGE